MNGAGKWREYARGEESMKNKDSETGKAEDMLRCIAQLGTTEVHYQTLYFKARAEMENGLIDVADTEVLNEQMKKIERYQDETQSIAEIRRKCMKKLFDMFDGGNKDEWCVIKHLSIAEETAFEVWQASDNDLSLLDIAYEINEELSKAVTAFLGMEITSCAACASDALKAEVR